MHDKFSKHAINEAARSINWQEVIEFFFNYKYATKMKKIIIIFAASSILSLSGCAAKKPMEFKDFSPRGVTVTNIDKSERIQARISAEKHCAKYFKVARVLSSKAATDSTMGSLVVECIKPNQ